jgi:hypothetical protein
MKRLTRTLVASALVAAIAAVVAFLARDVVDGRRFAVVADNALAQPQGFRFLGLSPGTDMPVRYDPCSTLRYVINPRLAPRRGVDNIHAAVGRSSDATGIEFEFEGFTDEVPGRNRQLYMPERYGERWPPLLIGWRPHDPAVFSEHDTGIGGSAYVANDDGRLVYVTGSIALDASERLDSGFGAGRAWGKVILHELGHVLGLDHVTDPAEVMNGSLVTSPATWGAGDLAGLRRLGRLAGCLEVPRLP